MKLHISRRERRLPVEAFNMMHLHVSMEKGMFGVIQFRVIRKYTNTREQNNPVLIMALSYGLT